MNPTQLWMVALAIVLVWLFNSINILREYERGADEPCACCHRGYTSERCVSGARRAGRGFVPPTTPSVVTGLIGT